MFTVALTVVTLFRTRTADTDCRPLSSLPAQNRLMNAASLALMWHQHQPYYPDDVSGENPMPWVRLHGTKDYIGMAMHIKEVPEFRCTINLVPSLLVQIRRYTEEGASDRHLDVSRASADSLSENDALYLLDHFFMANVDCMIRAVSAVLRAVPAAGIWHRQGRPGPAPLFGPRSSGSAGLVESHLDASAPV